MGDGTPTGRVGLTALNGLQDVQVIQHILHAAVVRQSIEKRSDRVLCLPRPPPFTSNLSAQNTTLALGGARKTSTDVVARQLGEIGEKVVLAHAGR